MDDSLGPRDVIGLSGMSYDNTGQLGANSWRHVAFIEQVRTVDLPMPTFGRPGDDRQDDGMRGRSEEHTSELQSRQYLVCRLLLEKKKKYHEITKTTFTYLYSH